MRSLPHFIFLSGPKGSGKTSLANTLADTLPTVLVRSFEAPLRMACAATFFDGDPMLDLTQPKPIPQLVGKARGYEGSTSEHFIRSYEKFLQTWAGQEILGALAFRECEAYEFASETMVFDDATVERMRPFLAALEPRHMLIVYLFRDIKMSEDMFVLGGLGIPYIELANDTTIPDLLARFLQHFTEPAKA